MAPYPLRGGDRASPGRKKKRRFAALLQSPLADSSAVELMEVLELAREGKIRPHVAEFRLERVEDAYAQLRQGRLDGRAVIVPHR
jgi:NADPH:quinone reductase-like Zn-dependent oxidoreductase